jgi:serine/threonine protein kinase
VAYAAPECLDPSLPPLSPKADVYSLGLVLWEMLAGERPWAGLRSHEILYAVVLQGKRPPIPKPTNDRTSANPQDSAARFPPAIVRLLEGCWEAEPGRRFNADEVAGKCRGLLKRLQLGIPLY